MIYDNIKLNEHIDELPEGLGQLTNRRFDTFYLPTETVLCEPKMFIPEVGRAYFTGLYIHDSKIMDYKSLVESVDRATFQGSSHYPEVMLVEHWTEVGDDGHVNLVRDGYAFANGNDYKKVMSLCNHRFPFYVMRVEYDTNVWTDEMMHLARGIFGGW